MMASWPMPMPTQIQSTWTSVIPSVRLSMRMCIINFICNGCRNIIFMYLMGCISCMVAPILSFEGVKQWSGCFFVVCLIIFKQSKRYNRITLDIINVVLQPFWLGNVSECNKIEFLLCRKYLAFQPCNAAKIHLLLHYGVLCANFPLANIWLTSIAQHQIKCSEQQQ